MNDGYNPNAVMCGNLTEAARFKCAQLRLAGCNGFHTALWIARGKATLTLNGQTHRIAGETGVIIDAATPKHIDLSGTAFGSVVALRATDSFAIPAPFLVAHVPNIGDQQRLAGFLECVMSEQAQSGFGADAAKFHMAHFYFVHLARLAKDPVGKQNSAQRLMARFARQLEQDFATGNGLSHYAETLGVTTTHLTRVSQSLNGCTATQMLQDRTFAEARILLATTSRPVVQVAAELGFSSAAYFTRLFSHKAGMTPTEYRHRNGPPPAQHAAVHAAAE